VKVGFGQLRCVTVVVSAAAVAKTVSNGRGATVVEERGPTADANEGWDLKRSAGADVHRASTLVSLAYVATHAPRFDAAKNRCTSRGRYRI